MKTLITILLLMPALAQAQQLIAPDEMAEWSDGMYACSCASNSPGLPVYTVPQDGALSLDSVKRRCARMTGNYVSVADGVYANLMACAPLVARKGSLTKFSAAAASQQAVDLTGLATRSHVDNLERYYDAKVSEMKANIERLEFAQAHSGGSGGSSSSNGSSNPAWTSPQTSTPSRTNHSAPLKNPGAVNREP